MANTLNPHADYAQIVRKFVDVNDAIFCIFSPDDSFCRILQQLFTKFYNFSPDRVRIYASFEEMVMAVKQEYTNHQLLLFVEHDIENAADMNFTRFIKITYSDVFVIFVTDETEKKQIAFLYENGIDNVITKPIDLESLIEKIAFTVEPQGKIGHLLEFGKRCLGEEQYEQALSFSDKVLEMKPRSAAGLMLKGDALVGLGQRNEALEAYEAAMESAKLFLDPLKKLAAFHKQEGDIEKELHYLEKLNKLSPLNLERKVAIGQLQVKLGKKERALKVFDDAVSRSKTTADSLMVEVRRKIVNMCIDDAPELAEHYLRQNLADQKDTATKSVIETYNTLGLALRRQGRWEGAVVEYKKGLTIAPNHPSLSYNLAMAYKEGKEYLKAAKALDRTIKAKPDFCAGNDVICANMGYVYALAGRNEKALVYLERALSFNPGNQKARTLLRKLQPPG